MAHKKKVWRHRDGELLEVHEYHTCAYGAPGQRRSAKAKPTPEEMARVNQRNRERACWRKLYNNFADHDLFLTMTYRAGSRPEDTEQAKKDLRKFRNRLKKLYKAAGQEMKFIQVIERGNRGGLHAHMVLNRLETKGFEVEVVDAWEHGKIVFQHLYAKGDLRDLAKYMVKEVGPEKRNGDGKTTVKERCYSTSRNLVVPEPKETVVTYREEEIRVPKGYALDMESIRVGVNPLGYGYRSYLLRRIAQKEGRADGTGKVHERRRGKKVPGR